MWHARVRTRIFGVRGVLPRLYCMYHYVAVYNTQVFKHHSHEMCALAQAQYVLGKQYCRFISC